jgi:predicted DCC family thiol-disulfide oxidoreductase YuxK
MRRVGTETDAIGVFTSGGATADVTPTRTEERARVTVGTDEYVGPRSTAQPETTPVPERAAPERTSLTLPGDRAILLYNSDCSVCRKLSSWVIANDAKSAGGGDLIDERPIGHDPAALTAIHPDLDIWQAYETIHLVMPDGTIKKGGEAVAEVLRRLPDTGWATGLLDISIAGWRPFQAALNLAYTILDRIRPALGCESCGTPAPWWAKPIEWAVKAWKAVTGKSPAPEQ